MYSLVHNGFSPLLKSYASTVANSKKSSFAAYEETIKGFSESDKTSLEKNLPVLSKRLNELEYAVRTCLHNMEIPEIELEVDSLILAVIEEHCNNIQTKVSTSDNPTYSFNLEELGLGEAVRTPAVLNRLQSGVNKWVKEIQKITKFERESTFESVSDEVQYWHDIDRALILAEKQVGSPAVQLTLEVLKQSGRALATILFTNDTNISEMRKTVDSHLELMNDFPINALISASTLIQVKEALNIIFSHLKKVKALDSRFPLGDALAIIKCLSRDFATQIEAVLAPKNMLELKFNEFKSFAEILKQVFSTWNEHARDFRDLVRQVAKRRSERLPPKVIFDHAQLQDRIDDIIEFRHSHEKLLQVLKQVLIKDRGGNNCRYKVAQLEVESRATDLEDDLKTAFQKVATTSDILNVTDTGMAEWNTTIKSYEQRVNVVERKIIERLTDRLSNATTATEMFRIFADFNPLFFGQESKEPFSSFSPA